MHKLFAPVMLLAICFLCYGCPFGSPYALEEQPKEKVQEKLLGQWIKFNEQDSTAIVLNISKKSDLEYRINIRGDLRKLIPTWAPGTDSIALTGFTSTVDGHKFFNILSQGQYYLVKMLLDDEILYLLPLSDKFTNSIIRNNQALKEMVSTHLKSNFPMYDDITTARGLVKQ